MIGSDPAELQRRVGELGWYHSIDLGHGIVTPGAVALDAIDDAYMPELRGRSVLDVGAWDGANSFGPNGSGPSRVVALDHYVWGVDFTAVSSTGMSVLAVVKYLTIRWTRLAFGTQLCQAEPASTLPGRCSARRSNLSWRTS